MSRSCNSKIVFTLDGTLYILKSSIFPISITWRNVLHPFVCLWVQFKKGSGKVGSRYVQYIKYNLLRSSSNLDSYYYYYLLWTANQPVIAKLLELGAKVRLARNFFPRLQLFFPLRYLILLLLFFVSISSSSSSSRQPPPLPLLSSSHIYMKKPDHAAAIFRLGKSRGRSIKGRRQKRSRRKRKRKKRQT